MEKENIKKSVQEAYGKIAGGQTGSGCCSPGPGNVPLAESIGYSPQELEDIPDGANMGLGCGNPTAIAGLKAGEVVLDLGSGAGLDCFLAASRVGPTGYVIGVDMTPEMIEKARNNARKSGTRNIEFRLGEIENLPVEDNSVDWVISNCVINLSTDKPKVFREIYRVLKPGGRVAISDIALTKDLPEKIRRSIEAYVGCVGGAVRIEEYEATLEASGLKNVEVSIQGDSNCIAPETEDPIGRTIRDGMKGDESLGAGVVSVRVMGWK